MSEASVPAPSPSLRDAMNSFNTPAPSQDMTFSVLRTFSSPVSQSSSCDSGCIAAAVIGSVLGFIILLLLVVLIWRCCRRKQSASRSTAGSQLDLLEDSISSAQGLRLNHQHFESGDRVFCKDVNASGACPTGNVISHAGNDLYKVRFEDGVIHVVSNRHMAPYFQTDASVQYMPPDGGEGISCTVIAADGSYWPPFYCLRPHNSGLDSINTTAEHLLTSGKLNFSHFGNDIIARAV